MYSFILQGGWQLYLRHCSRQWITVAANFTSSLFTYPNENVFKVIVCLNVRKNAVCVQNDTNIPQDKSCTFPLPVWQVYSSPVKEKKTPWSFTFVMEATMVSVLLSLFLLVPSPIQDKHVWIAAYHILSSKCWKIPFYNNAKFALIACLITNIDSKLLYTALGNSMLPTSSNKEILLKQTVIRYHAINSNRMWKPLHITNADASAQAHNCMVWSVWKCDVLCDTYHMHGVRVSDRAPSRPFRLHTLPHRKRCSDAGQHLHVFLTLWSRHNHLPCWKWILHY